jgi:hypothetical protein
MQSRSRRIFGQLTGDQTMRTTDLTGTALDWAVAKCEGVVNGDDLDVGFIAERGYTPSTNWAQGGAIIEREWIDVVKPVNSVCWVATMHYQNDDSERIQTSEEQGATPLVAAMRCYVASKLGDEIELPEELMTHA